MRFDCEGLPTTRCGVSVDWLFKPLLTFPEIEERGKRGEQEERRAERSEQVTREIKGAAVLRFLVSSCVLLSHLVKSVVASLYFLLLKNLLLISTLLIKCSRVTRRGDNEDSTLGHSPRGLWREYQLARQVCTEDKTPVADFRS